MSRTGSGTSERPKRNFKLPQQPRGFAVERTSVQTKRRATPQGRYAQTAEEAIAKMRGRSYPIQGTLKVNSRRTSGFAEHKTAEQELKEFNRRARINGSGINGDQVRRNLEQAAKKEREKKPFTRSKLPTRPDFKIQHLRGGGAKITSQAKTEG